MLLILILIPVYEEGYGPTPERKDNDQDDHLVSPDHGPAGGDGDGAVVGDGGHWYWPVLPRMLIVTVQISSLSKVSR